MGRELRRVPPNWEHQVIERPCGEGYQPMYDSTFAEAAKEWKEGFAAWERGERPSYCDDDKSKNLEYWEWENVPPDRKFYRPWQDSKATWYQVWETVSEGTPVSPPFETQQELIDYLVENGDFWDQKRRKEGNAYLSCAPWTREAAERFVFGSGWTPSFVIDATGVYSGVEYLAEDV